MTDKYLFLSFLGGSGGPFAESRVPKCQRIKTPSQWIHVYNNENDEQPAAAVHILATMCKHEHFWIFSAPWGRTSIIGLGLSRYMSIISFILIYMSNMEAF